MDVQRDFDIVEIPLEGVAAYWLSLKKLLAGKRNLKPLEDEANYTSEPCVKLLLELLAADTPVERIRALAATRAEVALAELARRLDLMRIALLDIAAADNPRKTFAKMAAHFPTPPLGEERAFSLVQELVQAAANPAEKARFFDVTHRAKPEQLMVVLLFYVVWARREDRIGCQPLLEFISSPLFSDGLALVIDGFDAPFVRKRLSVHRNAILAAASRKLELSAEMACGIRDKLPYESLFLAAKAYMP